jgi:peptidyl-prolyl cis-trans isomerase D
MATLETIRTKAGLLITIIIGMALLAFVLGDLLNSGKSMFGSSQFEIAEINGKSIPFAEYQKKVDELIEIYKLNSGKNTIENEVQDQISDQTWNTILQERVMENTYQDLGLAVSPEELFDMVQGKNPHPLIQQVFRNPETGQVNSANVLNFLKNMDQDPTKKSFWLYLENEISTQQRFSKFKTLVQQGLYVTNLQAKHSLNEKNQIVDFEFVAQNYATIPDTSIQVSESELKAYYEKHKNRYEQDASRDLVYVTFDILPSDEDRQMATELVNKLRPEFEKTEDNVKFVNSNSDVTFNDKNFKKTDLPAPLDSVLFDAAIGTVFGPYLDNTTFKIAKLHKILFLPDSVKASHILIKPDQNMSMEKAKARLDSIKTLILQGGNFADFAMRFSADGSAQKGGDLGWFTEGQMVKPFTDACFEGKKGDLPIVESQFGVHLIQIVDKGKESRRVQVAMIETMIEPSTATYQKIFTNANQFAGTNNTREKFEAAATAQNLSKRLANNIREADKALPGLEQPREMVRWAYKSTKNEVSPVFEIGNRFVVAVLTEIREKGIAPLEQVKPEIEALVRKDKKTETIGKKMEDMMKAGKSLTDIATAMKTIVQKAEQISFSSFQIPGAGVELKVIATAVATPVGKMSSPVGGNSGVFVLKVTQATKGTATDAKMEKEQLMAGMKSRSEGQAYEAMKKIADVKDFRGKFF